MLLQSTSVSFYLMMLTGGQAYLSSWSVEVLVLSAGCKVTWQRAISGEKQSLGNTDKQQQQQLPAFPSNLMPQDFWVATKQAGLPIIRTQNYAKALMD